MGWEDYNGESFLATGSILQHDGSIFFGGRKCLPGPSLELCFIVSVVYCQESDVSFRLLISVMLKIKHCRSLRGRQATEGGLGQQQMGEHGGLGQLVP